MADPLRVDYFERVAGAGAGASSPDAALYAAMVSCAAVPRGTAARVEHAAAMLAALVAGARIDAPRIEWPFIAQIALETGRPELIVAMKRSAPHLETAVDLAVENAAAVIRRIAAAPAVAPAVARAAAPAVAPAVARAAAPAAASP